MTILLKVFVHNNSQYLKGVNALNNIDANYYRDITNKKKYFYFFVKTILPVSLCLGFLLVLMEKEQRWP